MLRLPSREALKALRNPFRSLVPNPLRGPLQTRHLYTAPAPFSGPPSYATLARRFSDLSPSPIGFFGQKRAQEAIERGEFVDIHDVGGTDPKDYDVLITDMTNETLQSEISELVGIPYLQEATKDQADEVAREIHGFLYGRKLRQILPCVLSIEDKSRWVFFVVDSGAPLTYISSHVAQTFGLNLNYDPWKAKIAGHPHPIYMSPSDSHFSTINVLGQDFCSLNKLRSWEDDEARTVTYYIGKKKWKVIPYSHL